MRLSIASCRVGGLWVLNSMNFERCWMSSDVIGSPLTSSTTSSWDRAVEATASKVAAASTEAASRAPTAICDLIVPSPSAAGPCRLNRFSPKFRDTNP